MVKVRFCKYVWSKQKKTKTVHFTVQVQAEERLNLQVMVCLSAGSVMGGEQ